MNSDARIYVAGHTGLIGSAVVRVLQQAGYTNVLTASRLDLDLTVQARVDNFFEEYKPEYVVLAAGRRGSRHAFMEVPADIVRDNYSIQTNVIDAAYCYGARKLVSLFGPLSDLFLSPDDASSMDKKTYDDLVNARMGSVVMCDAYRRQYLFESTCMLAAEVYGPTKRFSQERAGLVGSLLLQLHEATERKLDSVTLDLPGSAHSGVIHSDDLAHGVKLLLETTQPDGVMAAHVAPPPGGLSLVDCAADIVGYKGNVNFANPDSPGAMGLPASLPGFWTRAPQLAELGWFPRIPLHEGLRSTYLWFLDHRRSLHP